MNGKVGSKAAGVILTPRVGRRVNQYLLRSLINAGRIPAPEKGVAGEYLWGEQDPPGGNTPGGVISAPSPGAG